MNEAVWKETLFRHLTRLFNSSAIGTSSGTRMLSQGSFQLAIPDYKIVTATLTLGNNGTAPINTFDLTARPAVGSADSFR